MANKYEVIYRGAEPCTYEKFVIEADSFYGNSDHTTFQNNHGLVKDVLGEYERLETVAIVANVILVRKIG